MKEKIRKIGMLLTAFLLVGSVFAGSVSATSQETLSKENYVVKKELVRYTEDGTIWKISIKGKNLENQTFEVGAYVIEQNGKYLIKDGDGTVYNSFEEAQIEILAVLPSLNIDLSTDDPNPGWLGTSNLEVHVTASAGVVPLPRLEYAVFLPDGITYQGVYTGPTPSITSTTDGCNVGIGKVGSGRGKCLTWKKFTRSYDKTTGINLKFSNPGTYNVPGKAAYFWFAGIWVYLEDDDYVIYRAY